MGNASNWGAKVAGAIVQWSPLGGSSWLLLHFLKDQEWAMSVVALPAMVVSSVWAAYTKGLISTLQASAEERSKRDGNAITKVLGDVEKSLKWRLTHADKRFAQAQGKACRDYLVEGLGEARMGMVPMLTEVYVPLALQGGLRQEGFAVLGRKLTTGEDCAKVEEECLYIWDLLRRIKDTDILRRMAIIAPGGFGKTTLLRSVAYRYGLEPVRTQREKKVPAFYRCCCIYENYET